MIFQRLQIFLNIILLKIGSNLKSKLGKIIQTKSQGFCIFSHHLVILFSKSIL